MKYSKYLNVDGCRKRNAWPMLIGGNSRAIAGATIEPVTPDYHIHETNSALHILQHLVNDSDSSFVNKIINTFVCFYFYSERQGRLDLIHVNARK